MDYEKGAIDENEYYQNQDAYQEVLEEKSYFQIFYKDYQECSSNTIIYDNGYQTLFSVNTNQREYLYSALIMGSMLLLLAGVFTIDQKDEEDILYSLTKKGNRKRYQYKQWYMLSVVIVLYLVVFGIEFLGFQKIYTFTHWNAPIDSINRAHTAMILPSSLTPQNSIFQYFIYAQAVRILGMVLWGYIIIYLSKYQKQILFVLVYGVAIAFLPIVLSYANIPLLDYFRILDLIGGNIYFQNGGDIMRLLYSLIIIILLCWLVNYRAEKTDVR